MCKSVAILLLIIAFVGAEDDQASSTGGAGSEGGKATPTLAGDPPTPQHRLDNTRESVPDNRDQAGVEAGKEDHAHDGDKKEVIETKINEKTSDDKTQTDQAGFTLTSTDDSDAENESADSEMDSSSTGSFENQQHHAINPLESVSNKKDETEMETINDYNYESSEESKTLKNEINDDTGEKDEVSMQCLDCLCKFATNCAMERQCEEPKFISGLSGGFEKGDCGPFHISFPFWADANNVTMDLGDAKMENEWRLCSLDLMCSKDAIQKYFRKYHHDCNGDGKVDCVDYAAIHTLGPFGCKVRSNLMNWNMSRRKGLLRCMVSGEEGPYAKKMKELNAKLQRQDIAAWKLAEIEKKSSVSAEANLQTNEVNPKGKINAQEADAQKHIQGAIKHV